jgi:hypothetical protein
MKLNYAIHTVCLILIASSAAAQDLSTDRRGKIVAGVKAGLNYSNVYNSQTEEFRANERFGFAGGLFLSIPLGTFLGVQPEILLSQKGFKGEGVLIGSGYTLKRTTTYIDIPLQVALKPSEYITILAGPQYSYLIKQKDVIGNSDVSYAQEQEINNQNIRKNIFGFVAGLDININPIVIGARAGWDITTNHGDGTSEIPRYKNTWLQATLGYRF